MRNYQPGTEACVGTVVEQGWGYCEGLADLSEFVVANLRQSWERTGGSGFGEQVAMWYAVGLVDDCTRAFVAPGERDHDVHQLIGLHPDVGTRYEAEAALGAVVRFDVTFEPYRAAFKRLPPKRRDLEGVSEDMREFEPGAVQAWHDWLWQPGKSPNDHGDASVFAVAAARLTDSMRAVLTLETGYDSPG